MEMLWSFEDGSWYVNMIIPGWRFRNKCWIGTGCIVCKCQRFTFCTRPRYLLGDNESERGANSSGYQSLNRHS